MSTSTTLPKTLKVKTEAQRSAIWGLCAIEQTGNGRLVIEISDGQVTSVEVEQRLPSRPAEA